MIAGSLTLILGFVLRNSAAASVWTRIVPARCSAHSPSSSREAIYNLSLPQSKERMPQHLPSCCSRPETLLKTPETTALSRPPWRLSWSFQSCVLDGRGLSVQFVPACSSVSRPSSPAGRKPLPVSLVRLIVSPLWGAGGVFES